MRADQNSLNNQSINQQQQQSSLPLINCQSLHGVASYSRHWLWFVFSPRWSLTTELFLSLLLKVHSSDGAFSVFLLHLFSTKQIFFNRVPDVISCGWRNPRRWFFFYNYYFYIFNLIFFILCFKMDEEMVGAFKRLKTDFWFSFVRTDFV